MNGQLGYHLVSEEGRLWRSEVRGVGRRELKELPRLSLCGGITEWANLQTNMGFETSNKRRFFFLGKNSLLAMFTTV